MIIINIIIDDAETDEIALITGSATELYSRLTCFGDLDNYRNNVGNTSRGLNKGTSNSCRS